MLVIVENEYDQPQRALQNISQSHNLSPQTTR